MEQGLTAPQALEAAAELAERPALAAALSAAAHAVRAGESLDAALARAPGVDPLVALTARHTPEEETARELIRLGELFEHRVTLSSRAVTTLWTLVSVVMMTTLVGLIVIAMFQPLIAVLRALSSF
jgi:type II secretory pathway component PulF